MENNTNKIIDLDNGKKYFIIKQILYKEKTYYVATELNDEETDMKNDNVEILVETTENDVKYVEKETNPDIVKTIVDNLLNN